MDIKLLVLDIDGTINGHSNQISDRVKDAINKLQEQGVQVAIATGRMYCSALRFHQEINSPLPLIAYNGAWLQNPFNGEIYHHLPVSCSLALDLVNYLEQPQFLSQVDLHCYLDDQLYVREVNYDTELYIQRSGVKPIALEDLRSLLHQQPTKILALCRNLNLLAQLKQELPQQFAPDLVHFTQSSQIYLEAIHPQANKGNATRYLAEIILGLSSDQVMAIGDNFNDEEMLEYAGWGVAMGNAPQEVQQLADWVAPDVEADGVAVTIEKFLLDRD